VLVQGTFGHHPVGGIGMVQWRQQCMSLNVGTAALDTHGALAASRQAVIDADGEGDAVFEAQTDWPAAARMMASYSPASSLARRC
jgi:hypothetical protein